MAQVYSPPKELTYEPDYSAGWDQYQKDAEAYEKKLRAYCNKHGEGDFRGEVISTPRGDGAARYMIFGTKGGVKLIHIPTGDAWQADAAWENGVNLAYVKKFFKMEAALRRLFAGE